MQDHIMSLKEHARYSHKEFFFKKRFFFMIFDLFQVHGFMILHHREWIFLLLHFSLDGARRLLCRAAQPITHMSGSGTERLQLYRKALCCCARSLLIRSDNLNEQSSKWRTEGKYCWHTCFASCALPPCNYNIYIFFKEVESISLTPKWKIWNIHIEISRLRCWMFKLTFFLF